MVARALAVALDKDMTRRMAESLGLTVPKGFTMAPIPGEYDGDFAEFRPILEEAGLSLPVIAKPTCEGSSKGIRNRCVIRTVEEFGPTILELWRNYQVTVEKIRVMRSIPAALYPANLATLGDELAK